ncbi:gas vesicle protein [Streptomyces tauricus]|uniref:GvpL/GvpF family gas vesicle protein n=1 Tax=Streptomyces tauricus TaxID=68274 RepID=UPI001678BCCE|nr:GvpL/GvpF family gas vesicle protein [Streptomyces tauricus]MCW8100878.1 GvpL/GvpF family gas vesicle protein [Streptomyces tauricus]GHA42649.1 gas vesicle protein [Streptomyces tauricus]
MSGLRYVYAVCRPFGTPLPAQLTGVAGVPPKQLVHGDLVAVVGQVPEEDFAEGPLRAHLEDLDWLGATARAHQNVIDALTVVTSPLPLRLATVFLDDSGVRSMMEEREETFLRTLDRLDGRVEWGVKVYSEPTEPSGETSGESGVSGGLGDTGTRTASSPSPGRAGSGRDYLRQRRNQRKESEEKWERAEEFSRRLHESLSGYAEDTRIHAPQNSAISRAPGRNILNAAYLVPRTESEAFVELVDRTKDDAPGLRVELTGPWACYSFSGEDA